MSALVFLEKLAHLRNEIRVLRLEVDEVRRDGVGDDVQRLELPHALVP